MFEIGDDDEDDPPAYDLEEALADARQLDHADGRRKQPGLEMETDAGPSTPRQTATDDDGAADEEEEMESVEIKHPVSKSDTILAIARRYAADVSDTCPSAPSMNPVT